MNCHLCAKLTSQTAVAFIGRCHPIAYICRECGYIRELLSTPSSPSPLGSVGGYTPWFTKAHMHPDISYILPHT